MVAPPGLNRFCMVTDTNSSVGGFWHSKFHCSSFAIWSRLKFSNFYYGTSRSATTGATHKYCTQWKRSSFAYPTSVSIKNFVVRFDQWVSTKTQCCLLYFSSGPFVIGAVNFDDTKDLLRFLCSWRLVKNERQCSRGHPVQPMSIVQDRRKAFGRFWRCCQCKMRVCLRRFVFQQCQTQSKRCTASIMVSFLMSSTFPQTAPLIRYIRRVKVLVYGYDSARISPLLWTWKTNGNWLVEFLPRRLCCRCEHGTSNSWWPWCVVYTWKTCQWNFHKQCNSLGHILHVDECCLFKRKYNCGRTV